MDIYNIFLVLIWIPILILCKNKINKLLKFFKINIDSNENKNKTNINNGTTLLNNIKKEYEDIKNAFNSEILSIKDELFKNKFPNIIKKDIIQENNDLENDDLNMNQVFNKSFDIIKQLFMHIFNKIKNFIIV